MQLETLSLYVKEFGKHMLWFCYTCGNDVIAECVVVISQHNKA